MALILPTGAAGAVRTGVRVLGLLGFILLLCVVAWTIWGFFDDSDGKAVRLDRAEVNAIAQGARADADRKAAHHKRIEDVAAAQARAAQMEAINATLATPDGDPMCAVLKCVPRKAAAAPAR